MSTVRFPIRSIMSRIRFWILALAIGLLLLGLRGFYVGPVGVMIGVPMLLLLWILALPLSYLSISYHLDRSWAKVVTKGDRKHANGWRSDSVAMETIASVAFLTPAAWSAQCTRSNWARSGDTSFREPIHPQSSDVSQAADDLIELVMRDFVRRWHTPLASGTEEPPLADSAPEFTAAVEIKMRQALATLLGMASKVDFATLGVRQLLPLVTQHFENFRKAESEFRGAARPASARSLANEEMDLFLASKYGNGKLHDALGDTASLNTKPSEQAFLRKVADRLVRAVMPRPELHSRAVLVVVREVMACTIMFPIIDMLSDPDFWNALLDRMAGDAIHEQKLVSKLREALDKQEETPRPAPDDSGGGSSPASSWLHARKRRADQRSFEAFLDFIGSTTSILEARRTKNDIAIQIRKTKSLIESLTEEHDKARVVRVRAYLQQLSVAYERVERQIESLGPGRSEPPYPAWDTNTSANYAAPTTNLQHVLQNPSSLSFFMEFMDRRRRSILVQFWMTVESFKTPLEDAESESDDENAHLSSSLRLPAPSHASVRTLKEDLRLFQSVYYSSPLINIKTQYIKSAQEFLDSVAEGEATIAQIREVRRSVLKAQRQVFIEMEEDDWPAFKSSDLFLKATQDLAIHSASVHAEGYVTARPADESRCSPPAVTSNTSNAPVVIAETAVRSRAGREVHKDLFGSNRLGMQASSLFGDTRSPLFNENSTSKLKSSAMAGNLDILIGGRTQHSGADGRAPLFRSDPLFDDLDEIEEDGRSSGAGSDYVQVERMDAIQHALHSIINEDQHLLRLAKERDENEKPPPSHASKLSDSQPSASLSNSLETSLQDGSARFLESEMGSGSEEDTCDKAKSKAGRKESAVRMAAPGDLNLESEIARISLKVEKLTSQEDILGALIRKAELTGAKSNEIRLLQKSASSVRRELRELKWQKEQYESQQAENTITPGLTSVFIPSSTIELGPDGKEYAVYLIQVSRLCSTDEIRAGQAEPSSRGWVVGRRYSEFWNLHQKLKDRFSEVRALESEFPGKRLVGLVHAPFVDARKTSLEKYLRALVKWPAVCASVEFRRFLSQSPSTAVVSHAFDKSTESDLKSGGGGPVGFSGQGLVRSFFRGMTGVAEGLDDLIGIGPSMLDIVAQRLSSHIGASSGPMSALPDIDVVSQAMQQNASAAELREAAGAGTTYWTEPICDLFVELFELKEKNNWMRRQAIVILLQQMFGSTIERKVRETVASSLEPAPLLSYITALKVGLWPNGELREPAPPRSDSEKQALRESANRKLSTLIPELAANFIGRENARRGTRRIFSALQNKRLNKHLAYSILETLINELFSESALRQLANRGTEH
ncbi:hypothetical protein IE53DRAFT_131244 [Violaceomyces palustris]|uniref:Uncharacterized protein n=1 Tax=Violaceomyces palustris TaxID=1673888 RepID=A0ACD0NV95_9BASI|nr:hypothetical protein IE53DRAFT_131244 [Violaceomyces palustris]